MSSLEIFLDDLEARIDPEVEDRLMAEWVDFTEGRFCGPLFSPRRNRILPPKVEWPTVGINAALDDFDLMALQQYSYCSMELAQDTGRFPCVRSNYGSSILPSLFGAELFMMEDSLNTLPTTKPIPGGLDGIRRLVDAGVPRLDSSLAGKALAMGERFVEIARSYPRIKKYVHIYHPDTQGPLDVAEVLVGSSIFLYLYDEPELLHSLLDLITRTYAEYLNRWFEIVPPEEDYSVHWHLLHKGRIMLRDDSAMNLSPQMYEEFVRPYDQRLLDEFGGGGIHFCGRGDHYIEGMSRMRGLYSIPMSQPHLNDMERIYRNTVDKGILLINFNRAHAEKALAEGRDLRGRVHVVG
jgi:hypothetical protein